MFQQTQRSSSRDRPRITITRAPTIDQSSLEYLYPVNKPSPGTQSLHRNPKKVTDFATEKTQKNGRPTSINGEVTVHKGPEAS